MYTGKNSSLAASSVPPRQSPPLSAMSWSWFGSLFGEREASENLFSSFGGLPSNATPVARAPGVRFLIAAADSNDPGAKVLGDLLNAHPQVASFNCSGGWRVPNVCSCRCNLGDPRVVAWSERSFFGAARTKPGQPGRYVDAVGIRLQPWKLPPGATQPFIARHRLRIVCSYRKNVFWQAVHAWEATRKSRSTVIPSREVELMAYALRSTNSRNEKWCHRQEADGVPVFHVPYEQLAGPEAPGVLRQLQAFLGVQPLPPGRLLSLRDRHLPNMEEQPAPPAIDRSIVEPPPQEGWASLAAQAELNRAPWARFIGSVPAGSAP